jgi:hypothetical protein
MKNSNNAEDNKIKKIRKYITLGALTLILLHLIFPELAIDYITLTLIIVAIIPWLAPIFKSLEFPGGWKIEFQEMKKQVDTMIAKQTESVAFSMKAYSIDKPTMLVIKALGNPDYTWRYLGGLADETKLSKQEILESIKWLLENALVTEVKGKYGTLWGLSLEGRNLLRNILSEEETKKEI